VLLCDHPGITRRLPSGWLDVPMRRLGQDDVEDRAALRSTVDALRDAWLARRPDVVLLDPSVAWEQLLRPERETRPLWVLGPDHRLLHDELAFLLGANRYDARRIARGDPPRWWPALRASQLGCSPAPEGLDADVLLPDARPAWIDGGPRGPIPGWPVDAVRVHLESIERCGKLDEERDGPPQEVLSTEQRAAVTHPHGPARVLAPAGSGKTRVLAGRLRHLVHDRGVQPQLITALAYNTRAAEELAERTRDVIVAGRRPQIRTVHALGLAVCTAAAGRRPRILDAAGIGRALELAGADAVLGAVARRAVLPALTEVRLALRDPETVEMTRGDVPGFTRLVPRYRRILHTNGWLDFDEQVHLAVALLLADPVLRTRVARSTTHLLVDEAQDLTPVFVLLVRLLAGPQQQLFAVGDDDQTIYGYAGATPRVLVDLPDAYRGAATYTLHVNHRCPAGVVRAATDLLAHNIVRVDKEVRAAAAARPDGVVEVTADGGGTNELLEQLRPLLADHRPSQVAVLARVGATLLAPQLALEAAGVPVHRHVGIELLGRSGIRAALAYLRCATEPDRISAIDLADTLRRPARRLTGVIRTGPHGTSLARLVRRVATVDGEHRDALRRYVDDLSLLATLVRDGADSTLVLRAIRDRVGLGASLDALDGRRLRPEGSSHGDDLDALIEVAKLEPDPQALPDRLVARLEDVRHEIGPAAPGASDRVTLSTVHRVKGREWDVVALVGLRAGLVPHRLCDDVEEERRVLHVALTRARRHLLLVVDPARPSPFLPELRGTVRPAHAPGAADEAEVLASLRDWRRSRASRDRVPAFLVAHDRTLDDIARRRPQDRAGLRACHGIGAAKEARYGDELLRLLTGRPAP